MDNILFASSDLGLLHDKTKKYLIENFEMKDKGEASFVLGIEIIRKRSRGLLGLSQKTYINGVFERFNMENCFRGKAPIFRGNNSPRINIPEMTLKEDRCMTFHVLLQ